VLLYDAGCGFCRWCVAKVLRWDRHRRLRVVALQTAEAERLTPGMEPARRMASWHLIGPAGECHSGGAAVAPLLRLLPGARPLAALAGALPGPTAAAYRLAARRRGRFGRWVSARARSGADRRIDERT
jgi:predicted DCC family thiol-disulfide oxidoreductase YuxK